MFAFVIEFTQEKPLYEQLYEHVKTLIFDKSLSAGEKLPSKRHLAQELGLSVQTIERAYGQLIAEGYVVSREKRGYFVENLAELFVNESKRKSHKHDLASPSRHFAYDFKTSVVDKEHFPYLEWARLEKEVILDDIKNAINSLSLAGYQPLREEIAKFIGRYRGIDTDWENIIIGSGSESLIQIVKLLVGESAVVGLENPGYPKTGKIYNMNGLQVLPVALDDAGMCLNDEVVSTASVLHVTPSHQFPTGKVMPISRRLELLKWAQSSANRYIVEDDYDSEFRFGGNPIPALAGLDQSASVIYLNSFTKSIAPSLRISFMVLPEALMQRFAARCAFYTCPVSLIGQVALQRFMNKGSFERHLNRMKTLYRNKRDELIMRLRAAAFAKKASIIGAESGLHFLLEFDEDISERKLVETAKAEDVRVYGLQEYFLKPVGHQPTIVIGYSGMAFADIKKAVSRLETAWEWLG